MIERSVRGDAVWIRLKRPEKMNALHLEGWADLSTELERAADEARVAVITGTDRVFCAGDDIETLASMDSPEDVTKLADRLYDVLFGIEELSIPVIAAVNGLAYGGGCEMVAAADLAVAVEDAAFALPETRIGAYPPFAAERLQTIGGKKRGMELILTGEPINAETAADWGLINRVVPRSALEESVIEYVDTIAKSPKRSTQLAKQHANSGEQSSGDRHTIAGAFAQIARSKECQRATHAFLDKSTSED
ncbi:3-hydroxypropionyl-coenzyme A dehydratase [Halalkalicoccus paucihalophilus]|uniref:3-hydroxypropionyl-coenzyme A dehydratase n=1 Tax=Halalkalicoccus paucihalophilus TaxID=1008153 RepID=A0A151AA05_9EURY|nr:enoyl-CoA hydratase/isomerase family protein [Halalkalicoccus paucihalophilus]KYH24536.1 3-hydroxypropionyl-coenzyme A dehydratase [Halalkalicoccus paucihalophilus]